LEERRPSLDVVAIGSDSSVGIDEVCALRGGVVDVGLDQGAGIGLAYAPLGVFFRRIERRKNRNVAVVATARKLAVIAWRMLTTGEPYRYALPKPTADKLARFRVRATAARRKSGPPKGTPRTARYGTGVSTRTVPALPALYAAEGVPSARPLENLAAAERRVLDEMGVGPFVQSIQTAQVQTRKRSPDLGVQCEGAENHVTST
jgi:hypothetical protein